MLMAGGLELFLAVGERHDAASEVTFIRLNATDILQVPFYTLLCSPRLHLKQMVATLLPRCLDRQASRRQGHVLKVCFKDTRFE